MLRYPPNYSASVNLDIDECYSPNACSPNATCRNIVGGYVCTCKSGFFGDGKNCTGEWLLYSVDKHGNMFTKFEAEVSSVDETNCLKNASICHGFASCINGKCVCDEGFVGDGKCCKSAVTTETPAIPALPFSASQPTGKTECVWPYDPKSNSKFQRLKFIQNIMKLVKILLQLYM